jgi:anti-sigma factor RsiW
MTKDPHFSSDLELDEDLMAYIDGRLPPDQIARVEARLATEPDARAATAAWRHHDNLIRQAAARADAQPANLRTAALERELVAKLKARQRRAWAYSPALRQMAAAVVVFAAGWLAHGVYTGQTTAAYPGFVTASIAEHQALRQNYLVQASFTADEMDSALAWMGDQMQREIAQPKLDQFGYQVHSARLVSTDEGPLGIFYYRNDAGNLITLAITPHDTGERNYPFRMVGMNDETLAYWTEDGLDYSILANVNSAMMTSLAAAVAP